MRTQESLTEKLEKMMQIDKEISFMTSKINTTMPKAKNVFISIENLVEHESIVSKWEEEVSPLQEKLDKLNTQLNKIKKEIYYIIGHEGVKIKCAIKGGYYEVSVKKEGETRKSSYKVIISKWQ